MSDEKKFYVTVRKTNDIIYEVYAYCFADALDQWERLGEEVDVHPRNTVMLSIIASEES